MFANYTVKVPEWLDRVFTWPVLVYRRYKYGDSFRRIYIGEGEWTIVDVEDYYRFSNLKWSIGGRDGKFYAMRGVKTGPDEIKLMSMHREIINAPAGMLVDHRNGNNLDNRRSNLRLATATENSCNRRKIKKAVHRDTKVFHIIAGAGNGTRESRFTGKVYFSVFLTTRLTPPRRTTRQREGITGSLRV